MADVPFGEWLKRQRKAHGLTQEQLASQVHCSTSALRKIEAEERRASVQFVGLIAEIFKIPSDERTALLKFARGDLQVNPGALRVDHGLLKYRTNLPASTTSFIGREKEIAEVSEYLLNKDIRLVTLIGSPGIGKTRLSIETVRKTFSHFPDGTFFVPLASLDNPSQIALSIFQTLGYVEEKEDSALDRIIDGIGDKQLLLVLDNAEHLIDEVAPLASRLLSACSKLKIMVTSRESLRVSGEWLYHVPALNLPKEYSTFDLDEALTFPALTLFAERARAVRSDFMLDADNIQTVSSICAQLDGLPLAIELIAARIRLMSPQTLLERLNDQFILSANGMRADSTRQKTLENAIGWSYALLSPDEQRLFIYLSIFSGGFTLDAAESMFSEMFINKPVRDLIALLLDKSLIHLKVNDLGEIRYDILVTIQQFALNYPRRSGSESEVHNLHLTYFLELAEQADAQAHGPDQVKWMDRLNNELNNFRAALNWSIVSEQSELCLQLFNALAWTWNVRWSRSEAYGWFEKIQSLSSVDRQSLPFAKLLNSIGLGLWRIGKYGDARSALEESLAISTRLGAAGELTQAEALNLLGMVARWGDEDVNLAESYFNQSLVLMQRNEDDWGVAWNFFHLGIIDSDRNQNESARSRLEKSLVMFTELGDAWGEGRVSQFLGMLHLKLGDFKTASFYFEQHLKNDECIRFNDGISVALLNLGELHRLQGEYIQAEEYYGRSLAISREYGMKMDIGVNLYNLGLLALQQDDYEAALRFFTESFEATRATYRKFAVRDLLMGLAAVAGGTKQPERAAKLSGAAQAIFDTTDNLFSPFDRAELDRHIKVSRNYIGKNAFDVLVMEGRQMSAEKALAYALAE